MGNPSLGRNVYTGHCRRKGPFQKKGVRCWVWKPGRMLWVDLRVSLLKEKSEGFL